MPLQSGCQSGGVARFSLARVRRPAPVQRVHAFRVRLVEVERVQGGGPRRLGRGPERRRLRAFLRGAFRDDDARGDLRAPADAAAQLGRTRARSVPRGVADRERPVRPRRSRGDGFPARVASGPRGPPRVPGAPRASGARAPDPPRPVSETTRCRCAEATPPSSRAIVGPIRDAAGPDKGGCGCGTPRRRARERGRDRRASAERATRHDAPSAIASMGKTRRRGGSDAVSCCCSRTTTLARPGRSLSVRPSLTGSRRSRDRCPDGVSILIGSAVRPRFAIDRPPVSRTRV